MRRLAAFARLPLADKVATAHAAALAVAVEAGLRAMSLPRLARAMGVRLEDEGPARSQAPPPAEARPALAAAEARRVRAAVRVYRAWPTGRVCLRRALVLGRLLRRRAPVLRIGVARPPGEDLHAHAWAEVDGAPLLGDASGFAALEGLPRAGERPPRLIGGAPGEE